jgi:metal-responsive CopG/Arc/MetJ family transcriptional regulator
MVKENLCFRIDPVLLDAIDKIAEKEFRNRSNIMHIAAAKLIKYYEENGSLSGFY